MELIDKALNSSENTSFGFFSPYSHQSRKVVWLRLKKTLVLPGIWVFVIRPVSGYTSRQSVLEGSINADTLDLLQESIRQYLDGIPLEFALGLKGTRSARYYHHKSARDELLKQGVSLHNSNAKHFLERLNRFEQSRYRVWSHHGQPPETASAFECLMFDLLELPIDVPDSRQGIEAAIAD